VEGIISNEKTYKQHRQSIGVLFAQFEEKNDQKLANLSETTKLQASGTRN
jgi:hypothetical protein